MARNEQTTIELRAAKIGGPGLTLRTKFKVLNCFQHLDYCGVELEQQLAEASQEEEKAVIRFRVDRADASLFRPGQSFYLDLDPAPED